VRRKRQTLHSDAKASTRYRATTLTRRQWEAPVDGVTPDLAQLPIDEVGDPVKSLTNDALVPVFTTKVRRHARGSSICPMGRLKSYSMRTIEAGARHEALSEIELELKSGNADVLFDLGTQLLDAAPLQLGTRSKAERGYALAFDVVQPAAKAGSISITTEHVVDDVIALLVGSRWHHLLKNHAVAEKGSDPEGVHQMRVALRRLRTICALFRRDIPSPSFQAVNSEARWLMQQLGPARDWDVFDETTVTRLVTAAGCRPRRPRARRSNSSASQATAPCRPFSPIPVAAVSARGHLVERRGWRNEIDSGSAVVLRNRCRRSPTKFGTIASQGAQTWRAFPTAQHRCATRSQNRPPRRLRYAAEFFLPLYATHGPAKRYVKRLARLQASLGSARDIASTRILLDAIRQDDQPALHPPSARGGRLASPRSDGGCENAAQEMARFKATPAFWGR
jgi:inorganic triphosphatase YgiF